MSRYWNYRIVRTEDGAYGIYEVHYDNDVPVARTTDPAIFSVDVEEGIESIISSLERALKNARELPVLTDDCFKRAD